MGIKNRRTLESRFSVPIDDEEEVGEAWLASGLILKFDSTDVPHQHRDIQAISEALKSIDCSVTEISIGTDAFEDDLRSFLDRDASGEQPRVIYVSGHGGEDESELIIASDASLDGYKEVSWASIQALVEKAECDVLVVVNCCSAGLARMSSNNKYAKEVIAATSWDSVTSGKLAPALCTSLAKWTSQSSTRTASSLYRTLTDELEGMRKVAGEKSIGRINDLLAKKGVLTGRIHKNRTEHKDLTKRIQELEMEMERDKEREKNLEQRIGALQKQRDKDKSSHSQPLYRRASSVMPGWSLLRHDR